MAIDPKLIDDLNSRRKKVILSGGQEKIDKRHEKGEMTARDRMGYLFEEGTFSEIGMHVRHNCHNFGMGKKEIPGDGVVSGFGLVDGRPVACAASDFLAQGGSLGYMHAMKIADAQKYALKAGIPMVRLCPGVLQQCACLRRGSANLHDSGSLRGRRGLLPRPDGLHHHAQFRQRRHVHHRPQGD